MTGDLLEMTSDPFSRANVCSCDHCKALLWFLNLRMIAKRWLFFILSQKYSELKHVVKK